MKEVTLHNSNPLAQLCSFLYDVLCKHIYPDDVEDLVDRNVLPPSEIFALSNSYLADYAMELATRLVPKLCEVDEIRNCILEPRGDDQWWLSKPFVVDGYAIVPREKYEAMEEKLRELEGKA